MWALKSVTALFSLMHITILSLIPLKIPPKTKVLTSLNKLKFIYSKLKQFPNIVSRVIIEVVSKLDKFNSFNVSQPKNINFIENTFDVSKLVTSIEVRAVHPPNMDSISVTWSVLKVDTFIWANPASWQNIYLILVTCEVSKLVKSILVKM